MVDSEQWVVFLSSLPVHLADVENSFVRKRICYGCRGVYIVLGGCCCAVTQLGDSSFACVRGAWVSSSYAWALLGVQVELDILLVDIPPMWQAYPSHV